MEKMVSSLPVSNDLKSQFTASRDNFNAYLNAKPAILFHAEIGAEINRVIFEAFLYGIFAHANRDKRRCVKNWQQQPCIDDLCATFDCVLVEFIKAVCIKSKICQQIREQITT